MSNEKDLIQHDDDDAVKFIQNYLPQELKGKFSNDEILYVLDVIYDFYEDKGLMDENVDEATIVDIDEDEMVTFVLKSVKKDKIYNFSADEVTFIIQGELAYEDSLGMFE
ncbi:hypothetical protein GGR21_003920 [Dysgonomonas hofstadii]|uniref:Uncharacterized protein n=1 Tax=Dysgonomonas hofstadii TaxID=637886 RepID=A0A840CWL6_9BACT|nr:hypothetical protein [Dysgonomonas hofstadii]MBB4037994.1 hypothetical protein [Dysgonomonas hofstadii]